ncbi:hypothetical protein [Streptomyces sp. NBC_00829]|uniref:hypothetical protein n=1 Tax=Streptomyces sp. NBC_00829 TaxID=2903679 RepID=UPI0038663774
MSRGSSDVGETSISRPLFRSAAYTVPVRPSTATPVGAEPSAAIRRFCWNVRVSKATTLPSSRPVAQARLRRSSTTTSRACFTPGSDTRCRPVRWL